MTEQGVLPVDTSVDDPVSLGVLAGEVQGALRQAGVDDAGREARRLIAAIASIEPEAFITKPEMSVELSKSQAVYDGLAKRLRGMPIGRIVGMREFYGRPFELGPAILEPRADSETLINAALEVIEEAELLTKPLRIIDVGTGSGCLLITLLAELPLAIGTGVDISADALAVAQANAKRNGVADRAVFLESNGLSGVDQSFDVLISNPPYIRTVDLPGLDIEVREHDPMLALDGGSDGLDVYRSMATELIRVVPDGWALFEVGAGMATAVCHEIVRFCGDGRFKEWRMWPDINGHTRCVAAKTLNNSSH